MNAPLAQRQIALAAAALLAVVAAVAIARLGGADDAGGSRSSAALNEWNEALAAPYSFASRTKLTACGQRAGDALLGLAHPVLPCGAKIVIRFEDREVLTQVVDRGAGKPGREFDLTQGLAERIGLTGLRPIQWRFASR